MAPRRCEMHASETTDRAALGKLRRTAISQESTIGAPAIRRRDRTQDGDETASCKENSDVGDAGKCCDSSRRSGRRQLFRSQKSPRESIFDKYTDQEPRVFQWTRTSKVMKLQQYA